jgi:hypothetical protein
VTICRPRCGPLKEAVTTNSREANKEKGKEGKSSEEWSAAAWSSWHTTSFVGAALLAHWMFPYLQMDIVEHKHIDRSEWDQRRWRRRWTNTHKDWRKRRRQIN